MWEKGHILCFYVHVNTHTNFYITACIKTNIKTKIQKEKQPTAKGGSPWGGKTGRTFTFMYFCVLFKFSFKVNVILLTFLNKNINQIKVKDFKSSYKIFEYARKQ